MRTFNIIDGVVYVNKLVFNEAQQVDNNVSKLTGSTCAYMFKAKPMITTGVESVTIDYSDSVAISINQDPVAFVEEMRETYQNKVRGHIVVDVGEAHPMDIIINQY